MADAAFILVAYLIGSLSFAVIVSRALGLPDPRSYGSGNPGATNVLRTGRKLAALLTLAGDGGKGWLAVFLAARYAPEYGAGGTAVATCSVAVFLGHVFPVFLAFKGGKGVATAGGVLLALDPWLGLAGLATWAAVALISRYASLASVVAAVFAPVYALFMSLPQGAVPALVFIGAVSVWRHRGNMRSLAGGRERKIGEKESPGAAAGDSASAEKS
ncbi:MAG TPA: glycerol-3-phosphate 1-O-acyltransferase PlsY [Burkholderiales bacterium]|nr:glycerol-3-phosphate 1-O-acyltransferase PlsY [Burkholderiales bacterium]